MATEMQVSSGFFDSLQGSERRYTAEEFSSIFDGLISDGVYENYPGNNVKPFSVTPATSGFNINIGPGRAWFQHVWVLNDSTIQLTIDPPHTTYARKDTVLIKVDKLNRNSYILVSKGEPSSTPSPTIPANNVSDGIYYYPIAYVTVPISAGRAEYCQFVTAIGDGGATPLVKAIVQPSMSFEEYLAEYDTRLTFRLNAKFEEIDAWKDTLSALLDGDVAANLGDRITATASRVEGHDTDILTINNKIRLIEGDNASLHQADTAMNTNIGTLLSYFDTALPIYGGTSYNIDSPPKTCCRMRNTCKGTMPSLGASNQFSVYTQTPGVQSSPAYNVQVAVGYGADKIAIRRRQNSAWTPWKYVTLT